jgi:hypothetical protein
LSHANVTVDSVESLWAQLEAIQVHCEPDRSDRNPGDGRDAKGPLGPTRADALFVKRIQSQKNAGNDDAKVKEDVYVHKRASHLEKAEPRCIRGVDRDSGTAMANRRWLRRSG